MPGQSSGIRPDSGVGGGIQSRTIKLDFSRFDGTEPAGWIYRAEQFFLYHQTPPNQRIKIASFHLEGKALQWFWWLDKAGAIYRWNDFTKTLMARFGPSGYDNPINLLAKLRQTASVQEHQEQFKSLANRTKGLNEAFMVSYFIAGLMDEILLGVQMFKPMSLAAATSLARLQEEKNLAAKRFPRPENHKMGMNGNNQPVRNPIPPIKKLSSAEMKECRERGLCYN